MLLIGWCLIFLRCETTEKSMVRALYLAQKEQSITVGLLYQAPEAAADASEASGAVQLQLAQADTLAKALAAAQKQLPQKADYRLCDYLLIDQDASAELLAAYERTVLENRQGIGKSFCAGNGRWIFGGTSSGKAGISEQTA